MLLISKITYYSRTMNCAARLLGSAASERLADFSDAHGRSEMKLTAFIYSTLNFIFCVTVSIGAFKLVLIVASSITKQFSTINTQPSCVIAHTIAFDAKIATPFFP